MKKKWKYLRDQFAAELKKFPSARSGDAAGDKQTSKWVYFQLLFFLKDVIEPRTSTGNLSSVIARVMLLNLKMSHYPDHLAKNMK